MRVAVIDDNQDAADSLAELLREIGHELLVAYSGSQVLPRLVDFGPDVIFCDLLMPEIPGWDVAQALRSEPALEKVTLVAWSGLGDVHSRELAKRAGFDAYLLKPQDVPDFLGRLEC